MNAIRLAAEGTLLPEDTRDQIHPLGMLGRQLRIDGDCTLRSLFRAVSAHSIFLEINPFLCSLVEEFKGCPQSGCTTQGIEGLVFFKTVEMTGYPGEPKLEIYNSLKGYSGSRTFEIGSSKLDRLLDLPISLGKLKHVVFGDEISLFEFETVYTLFEIIDGISWELSFQRTPDTCELRR